MSNEDLNECENCGCVRRYDEHKGDVCPQCIPCNSCGEPLGKVELKSGRDECFGCYVERMPE